MKVLDKKEVALRVTSLNHPTVFSFGIYLITKVLLGHSLVINFLWLLTIIVLVIPGKSQRDHFEHQCGLQKGRTWLITTVITYDRGYVFLMLLNWVMYIAVFQPRLVHRNIIIIDMLMSKTYFGGKLPFKTYKSQTERRSNLN